jgi:hypothetical protein
LEFDEESLIKKTTNSIKLENMSVEDLHEYIIDLKQAITQAQQEIRIKQEAIKGAKDIFKKK